MATHWSSDNRLLALGLGISVLSLYSLVNYTLLSIRDSRKVTYTAPKPQYIDQSTEDALQESTLQILIASHNQGISRVAQRIVVDRITHSRDAIEEILSQVASKDPEIRERALRALQLFDGGGFLDDLHIPRMVKAVVKALKYSAIENADSYPAYNQNVDTDDFRDPAEFMALSVLAKLVQERAAAARALVRTHFVKNWLAKQDWGKGVEQRQKNFANHWEKHRLHDNRLSLIIGKIASYEEGVRQLVAENLLGSPSDIGIEGYTNGYTRFTPRNTYIFQDPTTNTTVIMNTSGIDLPDPLEGLITRALEAGREEVREIGEIGAATRPNEQSAEERRLRRRNREVMVLNDGDVPLNAANIIETIERSGE